MTDEQPKIFCNTCRQITRHDITRTFEQVLDDGQVSQWQIIQCRGCDSAECVNDLRHEN